MKWEKLYAKHISDKWLIRKVHKGLIQFNSKTKTNPIKKQ